jgi:hypothetical protein
MPVMKPPSRCHEKGVIGGDPAAAVEVAASSACDLNRDWVNATMRSGYEQNIVT